MNTNKVFFAFGKAVETKESAPIKKYIGIAPVKVLAVNPTKAELEKIYNRTIDKEPEYLGVQEVNGQNVPYVRLDFILQTDPNKSNGIDTIAKMSLFIRDSKVANKDNTKYQVIDKYARTAWVTVEDFNGKLIPQYSNGPARIDRDYKHLYRGEETILSFIKTFLGISNVDEYVNGVWKMKANPEEYEAGFSSIDKWFKGDISEIKEAINMMPNNYIKVMFGIRTTDDGKEYQDIFTRAFGYGSSKSNTAFEKALKEAKEAGAYANTEFEVCDLKEFSPVPTNFDTPAVEESDDLPFNF